MPARVRSTVIAVAAITLTSIFFIDFCDLVFRCGCTHLWAGADAHCNIHSAGRHCPWCSSGLVGSYGVYAGITVPQAILAFCPRGWSARKRLTSSLLAFPLLGGAWALALGLTTGYWS